jgi:ankyrin repeat protein
MSRIYHETPLSRAVASGHDTVVKLLLARDDIYVNIESAWGETPLSMAVAEGHDTVVKLLLARDDINVNVKDRWNETPLSAGSERGYDTIFQLSIRDKTSSLSDSSGPVDLLIAFPPPSPSAKKLAEELDDVAFTLSHKPTRGS